MVVAYPSFEFELNGRRWPEPSNTRTLATRPYRDAGARPNFFSAIKHELVEVRINTISLDSNSERRTENLRDVQ
jgi:hypothetical protein